MRAEAEHLEKVIELFPKGDELQELMDFKKTNDPAVLPWARAEEFLIQLVDISDFKVRAECCLTRSMFASECDEVASDLTTLHQALTASCNCEHLRKIFAVVMQIGNYLNHGTNKGAQRGFSLDTLPLLSRVEGFEGKAYSLLRFIMDEVEPDVCRGALQELALCDAASKLDFDESVRRLSETEKRLAALEEALGPPDAPGDGEAEGEVDKPSKFGGHFEAVMRAFLAESKLRVSKLRQQAEEAPVSKWKGSSQTGVTSVGVGASNGPWSIHAACLGIWNRRLESQTVVPYSFFPKVGQAMRLSKMRNSRLPM